jgi:hypothetical protein
MPRDGYIINVGAGYVVRSFGLVVLRAVGHYPRFIYRPRSFPSMHAGLKHEQRAKAYADEMTHIGPKTPTYALVKRAHEQGQITALKEVVDIIDAATKGELHDIETINVLTKLREDIVKGVVMGDE